MTTLPRCPLPPQGGQDAQQFEPSPVGVGRVRGPDVRGKSMGWVQAGFILFAFAAPSAVMAVPYAIGMAGFLGGMLICVVVTTASVFGSFMLLQVKLCFPECHTFGELGFHVLGRPGQIWGNIIQLGNFCLFMPCALQFCAQAFQGIAWPSFVTSGFDGCTDYYVFSIALVCLLTTQLRTFSNTQLLSFISTCCVFAMAITMIVAAYTYDNPEKIPAELFGNPSEELAFVRFAGGFTISAWAYVPAFLTVELCTCMEEPKEFRKSLVLSGVLNVLMFILVGCAVVKQWGYNVGDVIIITSGVAAWKAGTSINTAFNVFQLIGNFISYMLDSIPFARFCQKSWAPEFTDTWSPRDIFLYLCYTLPTFIFALFLSIFVPSVNTMLDFTTALTSPWVTQIYPAVIYWKLRQARSPFLLGIQGQQVGDTGEHLEPETKMALWEKAGIASVFSVGCLSFVLCSIKAIGYIYYKELRPPLQIGCNGWRIY